MATIEQQQDMLHQVRQILAGLGQIKPESLVRAAELGQDLSFEAGLPVFQRTLNLFESLAECNLESVPFESLNQILQHASQVGQLFQSIRTFSLQQNPQNPVQARDALIQQLRDRWQQDYVAVTPHIAYAIRRGTDFDALEREARGTLALQQKLGAEFKAQQEKLLGEMQGALERVRQAAAEAGVAQHAIHFKEEAEFHKRQSYYWLVAAIVLGVATVIYAVFGLAPKLSVVDGSTISENNVNVLYLWSAALPRLVVIVVMTFGIVWSARNYAASRHNFVVNRHRQNALSSFETFVKGAGDQQTKQAVLLQATQSIFAPQDSGFIKGDTTPQPGSQIIEILRGMDGKS